METSNILVRVLKGCFLLCFVSCVAGDGDIAIAPTAAIDRVIIQYANKNATRGRNGLRGLEIVPLNEEDTVEQAVARFEVRETRIFLLFPLAF